MVSFLFNRVVKNFVNVGGMITATFAIQKAFFRWVQKHRDGGHNAAGNRRGQQPVVGVGDAQRACVGDKAGTLFWQKEEETVIKTLGGGLTFENSSQ
jgi:hypothetical protein